MTPTGSSEVEEKCGWCGPSVRERPAPHAGRSGHLDVYTMRWEHGSVIYSVFQPFLWFLASFQFFIVHSEP